MKLILYLMLLLVHVLIHQTLHVTYDLLFDLLLHYLILNDYIHVYMPTMNSYHQLLSVHLSMLFHNHLLIQLVHNSVYLVLKHMDAIHVFDLSL